MLVTAATDPYTQCGLRRLVCVSRIDDFLLHHLPNVYLGRLGLDEDGFAAQLAALRDIGAGGLSTGQLVPPTSVRHGLTWNKTLYGRAVPELEKLVPTDVDSVLTIGCGSGDAEIAATADHARIVGVPIDNVVGAVARQRGLEVLEPDLDRALERLAGQRFDGLLVLDVLHRFVDPVEVLTRLRPLVHDSGTVVVSVPNVAVRELRQLIRAPGSRGRRPSMGDLHRTGPVRVAGWLRRSGFRPQGHATTVGSSAGSALHRLPPPISRRLAQTVAVRATAV